MILSLNIGTSSVKSAVFTPDLVETVRKTTENTDQMMEWITTQTVDAIGVRIVHGGNKLFTPTIITEDVLTYLDSISDLAPLHNPLATNAIRMIRSKFPAIPVIGVFDTGFHKTMPDKAKQYAIPQDWEQKFEVYRYGFHGLAHASMLRQYCEKKNIPKEKATIITVQLGSGCSICAIKDGESVDTSMGFSPLEGLVSRTRSGDIDPAVIGYLSQKMNVSAKEIIEKLNHDTGLAGMSNTDGDIRTVLGKIDEEDARSILALEVFIYRIQKYLGAYEAILSRVDGYVFGGGISEHNPEILSAILSNPFLSRISSLVMNVNEEIEIAYGVMSTLTTT